VLRYLTHIREWYRNPFRQRPNWAEITILCLTVAIVLIYLGQLSEMHGAGQQTADLVKYAKAQACAARKMAAASERNANAAESFSTSADNAVAELKRQADSFSIGGQHDAIVNGNPVLYLCGRVIYWLTDEIIDSNKRVIPAHETTFCFQYDGIRREFAACESGNVMN
jgi:hypothetical protein